MNTLHQQAATIVTPILKGQVEPLRQLLASNGMDVTLKTWIPFDDLDSLHFMSWFIVEEKNLEASLILELNVDGPIEAFLLQLLAKAPASINGIYRYCQDYPAQANGNAKDIDLVRFLMDRDIGFNTYYIAWHGFTAQRIREERGLREDLESCLDANGPWASQSATDIRRHLQGVVSKDPTKAWVRATPPQPFLVRYGRQVLAALVVLTLVLLVGGGAALFLLCRPLFFAVVLGLVAVGGLACARLHWLEAHDRQAPADLDPGQVMAVTQRENRVIQNHFASITTVKPGLFRLYLLRGVLGVINFAAAVYFNRGDLGGIPTIHFARWVVMNRGQSLLFLSNYDGSWENYLDDFIDKASNGLTAVWSNTVGFPRTQCLIKGGARDEVRFKSVARRSQFPSLVWYSAYRDLTIQNIKSNAALRAGLFGPMTDAQAANWLRLL